MEGNTKQSQSNADYKYWLKTSAELLWCVGVIALWLYLLGYIIDYGGGPNTFAAKIIFIIPAMTIFCYQLLTFWS